MSKEEDVGNTGASGTSEKPVGFPFLYFCFSVERNKRDYVFVFVCICVYSSSESMAP
jgi:hypothetical protein